MTRRRLAGCSATPKHPLFLPIACFYDVFLENRYWQERNVFYAQYIIHFYIQAVLIPSIHWIVRGLKAEQIQIFMVIPRLKLHAFAAEHCPHWFVIHHSSFAHFIKCISSWLTIAFSYYEKYDSG